MKHLPIVLLILLIALGGCKNKTNNNQPQSNSKAVYGIDVSHHQGDIEWEKVSEWKGNTLRFVYIKATEGATYLDSHYKKNLKGAKKNGIKVGTYHYFRTTSSPEEQFDNFIKHVDMSKQDLIPMIDLEENDNWDTETYNKNLKTFIALVEGKFKKKPLLYSVQGFYNTHLKGRYHTYHWNIARYSHQKPYLLDKNRWTVWQFSQRGKVAGIKKFVDLNIMTELFKLKELEL